MRAAAILFRKGLCVALWAMGALPPLTQAADPSAANKTEVSATDLSPEITEALDHLEPLGESMKADIVSCEVRYRKFYRVAPITPLTPIQVRDKLKHYDLGEHPERAPDFLRDVAGLEARVETPTCHLLVQGQHRWQKLGTLAYIDDDNFSFAHDGDNKLVKVYERGRCPVGLAGLEVFRTPMPTRAEGYRPDRMEREEGILRFTVVTPPSNQMGEFLSSITADQATGVVLNRLRVLNGEVIQEMDYSGLTTLAGGVTFPRCAVTARYQKGCLQNLDLALLDEARLNETIPESTFVVSLPEGWRLLDFREQAGGRGIHSPKGTVDDVRTLIPAFAFNSPLPSATRTAEPVPLSNRKRVLLILNGLGLIALGVWMWKRASLKELTH